MSKKDALIAQLAQIKKIEAWPARITRLGKSDRQFCLDNGIDVSQFSRIKNIAVIAAKASFDQIEAALAREERTLGKKKSS